MSHLTNRSRGEAVQCRREHTRRTFSKLQEVLAEIQRLKEEANRFISILAEEDDPEKANELLSPGKRQSLTREVESLQVRSQLPIYVLALLSHYRD